MLRLLRVFRNGNYRAISVCCISIPLLLLVGCLPNTDISDAARDAVINRPNSFAHLEHDDSGFQEGFGGSGSTSGLKLNEVRVSVQVPASSSASSSATRQGLVSATDYDIRVYRVNESLAPIQTLHPIIEREGNTVRLRFPSETMVPPDIDLVVEANVNGHIYTAPLAAASRHVRVNPFSHYLIQNGLGRLSQDRINMLKSCAQTLCPAELVWPALVNQTQNFEIDIPPGSSPSSSRALLENHANFANFVDTMVDFLSLNPTNINSLDDGTDAGAFTFNTVYFGLELNRLRDAEGANLGGMWATRTGIRGERTNDAGTGYTYPNLTIASFALQLLDLSFTSMASTIPYQRQALNQDFQRPSDAQLQNEHSAAPGATFTRGEDFLTGGRPVYQTITRESTQPLGWAPDPYVLDARIIGGIESPQALLAGYFHAGKALTLSQNSSGGYERAQTREELNTAAFEINLRQTPDDEGPYSLQDIPDAYNVLTFGMSLNQGGTPVQARAELAQWSLISGGDDMASFFHDDGNGGPTSLWRLGRSSADGSVSHAETSRSSSDVDIHRSEQLNDNLYTGTPRYRGHLFLNPGYGTELRDRVADGPNGAGSPDKQWLAFATSLEGGIQELTLAMARPESMSQDHWLGQYQIQGFAAEMTSEANQLKSLNGACLTLGGSNAELAYRGLQVTHEISDRSVTSPRQLPRQTLSSTDYQAPNSNGEITITFAPDGDNLPAEIALEGFTSADGKALMLRKRTPSSLGALLALRVDEDGPGCQ